MPTRRGVLFGAAAAAAVPLSMLGRDQAVAQPGVMDHAAMTPGSASNHAGHAGFPSGSVPPERAGIDPTAILRDFDKGKVSTLPDGRTLREWEITAYDRDIEIAPGVTFPGWTYNGRIPGPSLWAQEGDALRIGGVK